MDSSDIALQTQVNMDLLIQELQHFDRQRLHNHLLEPRTVKPDGWFAWLLSWFWEKIPDFSRIFYFVV